MSDITEQDSTRQHGTAEHSTAQNGLLDKYAGEVTLRIDSLPALKPQIIPTRSSSPWRRFLEAGRRRTFTLVEDFKIDIAGDALPEKLQGCIIIPTSGSRTEDVDTSEPELTETDCQSQSSEPNVFDGASIPFPWIISYISFGVLRPLGILLSASVVHDFCYQFGYLPIKKHGKCKNVPVARHEADELFRLITATLNRSRFFSRLAWHAVRLGWWGIPYSGRKRTGKPPIPSTALALTVIAGAVFVIGYLRRTWLADTSDELTPIIAVLGLFASIMGIVYLWIAADALIRKSTK